MGDVVACLLMNRVLLCTWLLLAPGAVSAQPMRVAIVRLDGRDGGRVTRILRRALERRGYEVTRLAGGVGRDPDAMASAVEASGAEAVIGGTVRGSRGRWRVRFWIRDRHGEERERFALRVRGRRGRKRLVRKVHEALQRWGPRGEREASSGVSSGVDIEPETGRGAPARRALAPSRASDPVRATALRASSEHVRDEQSAVADAPASERGEAPWLHVLVQAGAGVRSRAVELPSPDGREVAYRAPAFFEVSGRAKATAFGIGVVRVRVGASMGLESVSEREALGHIDTSFVRLRADGGAQVLLGRAVLLGAVCGVGWDRYALAFNALLPSMEYVYLRPALYSAFRFAERLLVFEGEVGLRVPRGVGDVERLYGAVYEAVGADVLVRVSGELDPGLSWSVEGGWRRYWLTRVRPEKDARGFDAGWHAAGLLGWSFR